MKRGAGVASPALALFLAGMNAAGCRAAHGNEPMKDPQQFNHEAWQASPHGRSWQAEAERGYGPEAAHPAQGDGTAQEPLRAGMERLRPAGQQQPAEPDKGR